MCINYIIYMKTINTMQFFTNLRMFSHFIPKNLQDSRVFLLKCFSTRIAFINYNYNLWAIEIEILLAHFFVFIYKIDTCNIKGYKIKH